ncbi:cupin domain-containing protein [Rhodococcus sp. IEGM 1305]|uniref:cupin domain-containing protein n=1 Tax=Rhodococcus sp. IEGM 1305 TaxID=3047092 RepID=UPI0024B7C9BE|nr:cupin domain-containing protein [Rhodococcus sp. IEGM 1305]MDI9953640.1 hypothetical protein [Rhodococcus sp. IEGM 1305]
MTVRRVVTGFNDTGEAVFLSDEHLNEVQNLNTMLSSVWRTDSVSTLQIPPKVPAENGFGFPMPGGTWALSWSIPPRSVGGEDQDQDGVTKAGDLPSGAAHATDSIDINVVTSGAVAFALEDGTEQVLEGGDVIVVNGVRHTWSNRGDETATILSFILGAERTAH